MSLRFLLDTNICIYIRQKKSPEVLARFDEVQAGEAAMSIITHGELLYGAERSQNREVARRILSELVTWIPVLSLPDEAAEEYGRVRANLEARGIMIGTNDLWIAAHVKVAGLTLVTNNEKEFRRISGLKIENWASKK
jgi:tRNA(fMet)-specific endonuclease VapC